MANYNVVLTDTNGQFTFSVVRNPTSVTVTGGTSLNTNTFTQNSASGALLTASGFQVSDTTTSDGLGHVQLAPHEALNRVSELIRNDRSFNG